MIKMLLTGARDRIRSAHDLIASGDNLRAGELLEEAHGQIIEALKMLPAELVAIEDELPHDGDRGGEGGTA